MLFYRLRNFSDFTCSIDCGSGGNKTFDNEFEFVRVIAWIFAGNVEAGTGDNSSDKFDSFLLNDGNDEFDGIEAKSLKNLNVF